MGINLVMNNVNKASTKRSKKKLLLTFSISLVALCSAITGILAIMVMIVYPQLPDMDELRNYQPKLPLQVYSEDGVLLGQFGEERRIFISFNNTPKMLINAILSAEDERFYQHGGIDYIGVIRALGLNILSGRKQSGASTITMQVAKNFFLSSQKTYARKFNEVLLAYKIEQSLTKDQILELYINQIYLGQRAYGFAEAALTYFGRKLDTLTIAEYAVLAGLPKAPSIYNPIVNKKRSHERSLYVLGHMKNNGLITEKQYIEAIKKPIVITKGNTNDFTNSGGYVAEMVRQMLYDKYGSKIYTDGYKVYTTINSKMETAAYTSLREGLLQYDATHGYRGAEKQLKLEATNNYPTTNQIINSAFDSLSDFGDLRVAIVTNSSDHSLKVRMRDGNEIEFKNTDLDFVRKFLTSGGDKKFSVGSVVRIRNIKNKWYITQIPTVEGALVAINPNDGGIKALVGGFDCTHNSYNHVIQAMRQPGSSFKPFIYSAALDKGFAANSVIEDSEICFDSGGDNGGQWCPRNDDEKFLGPISFRQGLTLSRNLITVKILNQISPKFAIDYVTKFGFNKSQFQPYLTMALGANEVTPMQIAQAFSVFANGGYLIQPYLIKTISDNKGNILAKTEPIAIQKDHPAIDPRNAFVMNSILQDVVRYGTGARAYKELKRNDIAGKTGTTTDAKDVWFNGYTPNLVAITWIGYDQPKSLGARQYGATLALPIWINFMRQALADIPEVQRPMPHGISVLHNATWKGNDEYIYDSTIPADLTDQEQKESSIQIPNNNTTTESPSVNDDSTKPSSIDDLIQKIQ